MIKICSKCSRVMNYEPYFKSYLCRQCGNEISVKVAHSNTYQIVKYGKTVSTKKMVPLKSTIK